MNRSVLIIASLALVFSASLASAAQIQGAGARTCKQFAQDSADMADVESIYVSWALGYISRLNVEREGRGNQAVNLQPGSFNYDDQKRFLRRFCASNPSSQYVDAARALWLQILSLNGVGV